MTVWSHLPTIFNQRYVLRFAGLTALCVALITTLLFAVSSSAAPGINKTISFQGRLLDSSGEVVPDGYYNVQFKIYQDGTGTAVGNPGGTLKWTETYINDGSPTGAVQVVNGFMSVNLGSITPFGTSVDWNQDTLWLSMNVAGSSASCTSFDAGACEADGEMLPMKRLTASPYAMNAGAVNGKTADNFVQLAQGVQTDASTNTSSIYINKTGSGHLLQLQSGGNDAFTVTNAGDLMLGNAANHSIFINTAGASTDGRQLAISGGNGGSGTGTTGGTLSLQGGNAGGTNGNSGSVQIDAGAKTGTGNYGYISIGATNAGTINVGSNSSALTQDINIGTNNTSGSTSNIVIGAGGSATGGTTTIQAKDGITIATNGTTRATFSGTDNIAYFGNGESAASPNDYTIQGTNSSTTGVSGGSLSLQGGNATAGDADGGNITISGGSGNGTGTNGVVVMTTPTFSTISNDANCYTGGSVVASSCSVAASTVNNASAVIVGFSAADQTASLPDPTNTTPGRIFYVTAANTSENFILSINGGGSGNEVVMRANTTASLLWNGSDWTSSSSATTPTTIGQAATAPTDAPLGSMYYDTTIGKVQCYEADGWGACGSSPDSFITLSPEYTNAVTNGAGIGTMSSDLCSDTLNINDGSSAQPTICSTNETYNFYQWTSAETSSQEKSVYVTYQLPSTFDEFVSGSTSLMGRTDSSDSSVTYQVYRNDGAGLTACGSAQSVSSGIQTSWQQAVVSANDPALCGFDPGDSIVFKITMAAANDANAYVSNLNFTFSNQ